MRVYLYAADIVAISGKGLTAAYGKLNEVRKALGKQKSQPVTVEEFAAHESISPEEIRKALK